MTLLVLVKWPSKQNWGGARQNLDKKSIPEPGIDLSAKIRNLKWLLEPPTIQKVQKLVTYTPAKSLISKQKYVNQIKCETFMLESVYKDKNTGSRGLLKRPEVNYWARFMFFLHFTMEIEPI